MVQFIAIVLSTAGVVGGLTFFYLTRRKAWLLVIGLNVATLGLNVATLVAAFDTERNQLERDSEPCGDDCLAPGEELHCMLDLVTGAMECRKETPRPEGVEA